PASPCATTAASSTDDSHFSRASGRREGDAGEGPRGAWVPSDLDGRHPARERPRRHRLGRAGQGLHGPRRPGPRRAHHLDDGAGAAERRRRDPRRLPAHGRAGRGARRDARAARQVRGRGVVRRRHGRAARADHVVHNPPKAAGVDDVTGEPLVQRPDDNDETIRTRLAVYETSTAPLIAYYEKSEPPRLVRIDALAPIADVSAQLENLIAGGVLAKKATA